MINVRVTDKDMKRIGLWIEEKKEDPNYRDPKFKLPFREFQLHFASESESSRIIYKVKQNKKDLTIETDSIGMPELTLLIKCKITDTGVNIKKLYSGKNRKVEILNDEKAERLNNALTPLIMFIKYTISPDKELKVEKQLRAMKKLFSDKTEKKEKTFSNSESKEEKNINKELITTINKVNYSQENEKILNGVKRHYTKPTQEVPTRGHYRHYRSGKIVWIKETVKYRDKDKIEDKTYKL